MEKLVDSDTAILRSKKWELEIDSIIIVAVAADAWMHELGKMMQSKKCNESGIFVKSEFPLSKLSKNT